MKFKNTVSINPRGIARVAWIVIALSIVVYFSWHLWMLYRAPMLVLDPKNDIMTHDGFIMFSGTTQKESHIFINSTEIPVNKDGTFQNRITLADGMNAIEVRSVNKFSKVTIIVRRIIKN